MLFNSLEFLFIFLPIIIFLNYYLNKKNIFLSKILLIISSLVFYALWNIKLLPLLIFSILINYYISNILLRTQNDEIKKKYLICGIMINIIIL